MFRRQFPVVACVLLVIASDVLAIIVETGAGDRRLEKI